ncbi:MAG: hypothetical protein IJN29_14995 [Akkermansia sp.]|nr:hypothetical protein [Akkermansia sp.]
MGTAAVIGDAVASIVGAAASVGSTLYASKQQKKAARSAAHQASKIADSAIARSTTDTTPAQQTNTEATARTSTQNAAKRRMSVSSTVNRIGANGGRLTLN